MINKLNILKLAVATKPLIPVMSFIDIYTDEDGVRRMQANNGRLCMDTPVEFPFDVTVRADKFIRAVKLCKKEMKCKITAKGKLSISSGKFRAIVETSLDKFPRLPLTQGQICGPAEYIPSICKVLLPFVSQDASRPWSRSILFKNGYAYATNNIIIARVPCGKIPDCVIPAYAVEVLSVLGANPTAYAVEDNYLGFYFEGGSWIRTCIIDAPWPDVEAMIIPTENTTPLPDGLLNTINDLMPFCHDAKNPVMYMSPEGIHTGAEDYGAGFQTGGYHDSKFRAEMLALLSSVATHVDFTTYPKPCYFKGGYDLDGIIMGVR